MRKDKNIAKSSIETNSDNIRNKKVSVIIPTLQKNKVILDNLVSSLDYDNAVSEIILIDNSMNGYKHSSNKLRVISPKENLYVNPSWNLGVKEAKEEIIALFNDDIIISKNFCKNVIQQMNNDMGIVGFNSGKFIEPVKDYTIMPKNGEITLERTKFMDLYFGIAMFFYKSSYFEIPEDIKITYGDVWLYHQNKQSGRKNYRICGQTIYHWGSLSSSSKSLNPICKNDAKLYKKYMIKWYDKLFSFDNVWDCYKLRLLGITFKIKKFI